MYNPYEIVRSVMITEKATAMADTFNKYTFKVDKKATKAQIAKAVAAIFEEVTVSSVNVMNYAGKKKRMRSARMGKRPDWKKAVVTLSEGKIELL